MTFREIGLLSCALLALYPLGRIVLLLLWRRPVLARVLHSDYSDIERRFDRDLRVVNYDNILTVDVFPIRNVTVRARYAWAGVEYVEDVPVYVFTGNRPDGQLTLWIDPSNPAHVTSRGIGVATVWLMLIGLLAVGFWGVPF